MEQIPDAPSLGAVTDRKKASDYIYQMATLVAVLLLLLTTVI
jgi:hypothetical protein